MCVNCEKEEGEGNAMMKSAGGLSLTCRCLAHESTRNEKASSTNWL